MHGTQIVSTLLQGLPGLYVPSRPYIKQREAKCDFQHSQSPPHPCSQFHRLRSLPPQFPVQFALVLVNQICAWLALRAAHNALVNVKNDQERPIHLEWAKRPCANQTQQSEE